MYRYVIFTFKFLRQFTGAHEIALMNCQSWLCNQSLIIEFPLPKEPRKFELSDRELSADSTRLPAISSKEHDPATPTPAPSSTPARWSKESIQVSLSRLHIFCGPGPKGSVCRICHSVSGHQVLTNLCTQYGSRVTINILLYIAWARYDSSMENC